MNFLLDRFLDIWNLLKVIYFIVTHLKKSVQLSIAYPIKISAYLGVFYAYLISGNPIFLTALFIAATLESFSKIRLDVKQDKFTWKRSACIVFGKFWYLALIIISTQLDYILIELGVAQQKITVTNGTVLCLFVYDAFRFIKNVKQFGIPVPDFLIKAIKKLSDSVNKG